MVLGLVCEWLNDSTLKLMLWQLRSQQESVEGLFEQLCSRSHRLWGLGITWSDNHNYDHALSKQGRFTVSQPLEMKCLSLVSVHMLLFFNCLQITLI